MRFDVVIVGAGIGGAVLALDLGRRGWRVALLEREATPPRLARPEVLWGETPRALEAYGVADIIRETAGVRLTDIAVGGETPWLRFTPADFAGSRVDAYSTNPAATRLGITQAAMATGNVETFRGVAVTDLLIDDGRVVGARGTTGGRTETFEAALVVGDDGGRSIVRTRLGIELAFETIPIEFVTAALPHWPLDSPRVRVWLDLRRDSEGLGAAGLFPWPAGEGVLLLPMPPDRAAHLREQSADAFWSDLARLMPLAAELRAQLDFPRDFTHVARPFGHAAAYVAAGAALIGDAAHPMTPAGGQGANASIWDALALADVADAALRAGDVSRARLLAYERLRRPINERSVSISRRARRAISLGGHLPAGRVVPIAARSIDAMGCPKRRILRSFSRTFVHPRHAA